MPRGATDMSRVHAGRRAQARRDKLAADVRKALVLLTEQGYVVTRTEPVDERKEMVTTPPATA